MYMANSKKKEREKVICKTCGKEIKETAKFCGYCGSVNEPTIGVQTLEISETVNYTPSWMKQEVKTMDEFDGILFNRLEELRSNYCKDVVQLEEIHFRLRERFSLLSAENSRHIDAVLKPTVECDRSIEEALHKLHEATDALQKYIQLLHEYSEVKF